MNYEGKENGVYILSEFCQSRKDNRKSITPVDLWAPSNPNEAIVNVRPGYFIAPITVLFNLKDLGADDKLDYFILSKKKCYNSGPMRNHLYTYINYFCNYYDPEWEYISVLYAMKVKMDRFAPECYPIETFFYDLERYILSPTIVEKVKRMVNDNYYQELNYENIKNPSLQYTNDHAKILHMMSILMDLSIPLLTNYAYMHKVEFVDEFLMTFYDKILNMIPGVNIYTKLYDTAFTNVVANQRNNQGIWIKQDIRSIDTTTHSTDSVYNIILNIMPKYTFDKNIISFNYASIRRNTSYKITDISFEFSYIPISGSKRVEGDSTSEFDKFESNLIKANESLYLQNKINCQVCMANIEREFGPFDANEIAHYTKYIITDSNGDFYVNSFQKQLVFDLFFKWFRDTQSIYSINREEYVKLIIAAKRMLISKGMILLPYLISGRIDKLVQRKNVNKKERLIIENSPNYPHIIEKYKNPAIVDQILSIVATIISSDFSIIDMNPEINEVRLEITNINVIIEEVLIFILMI